MGCKCTGLNSILNCPDLSQETNQKNSNTNNTNPFYNEQNLNYINNNKFTFSNETTKTSKIGENSNANPIKRNLFTTKFYKPSASSLALQLLDEINLIRTNPKAYKTKINKYIVNITNKNGNFFLNAKNDVYINLKSGTQAFTYSMDFLSNSKPINSLQMDKNLKFDIEAFQEFFRTSDKSNTNLNKSSISSKDSRYKICQNEESKYTNHFYIEKAMNKQFTPLLDKYDIIGFHYDKSTDNPELSAVLQIVDDTNSNYVRRNMIMNPKVKYVGINAINIKDNIYCYYLIFGNKK